MFTCEKKLIKLLPSKEAKTNFCSHSIPSPGVVLVKLDGNRFDPFYENFCKKLLITIICLTGNKFNKYGMGEGNRDWAKALGKGEEISSSVYLDAHRGHFIS